MQRKRRNGARAEMKMMKIRLMFGRVSPLRETRGAMFILDRFFYWSVLYHKTTKCAHERTVFIVWPCFVPLYKHQVRLACCLLSQLNVDWKFTGMKLNPTVHGYKLCTISGSPTKKQWEMVSVYVQCNMIMRMQRATVYCYSMSSGLTGWGSGMIDFFSVSLDRAFLISATSTQDKLSDFKTLA